MGEIGLAVFRVWCMMAISRAGPWPVFLRGLLHPVRGHKLIEAADVLVKDTDKYVGEPYFAEAVIDRIFRNANRFPTRAI